jgi:hypothetical protein
MPAEYRINFGFQSYVASDADMCGWVDGLIKCCHPTNIDGSEEDLRKACRLIVQGVKKWRVKNPYPINSLSQRPSPFTDRLLGKVMCGGLRLSDRSLCCEALSAVIEQLPQPTTVEVINSFGFAQLKNE